MSTKRELLSKIKWHHAHGKYLRVLPSVSFVDSERPNAAKVIAESVRDRFAPIGE